MNIIPAIDILNGKVVRLRGGDYDQATVYDVSVTDMLDIFSSKGTDFVQIIDLNGAKGDFSNQDYVMKAIKRDDIKVQYGGGIRSIDKVKELIDLGFHRIIVGTMALTNPGFLEELSAEICGKDKCSDQVVIAIDVLDEIIKYSGWMESSPIKLRDYIDKCTSLGYFRFLCTDIEKDGRMAGSGLALYKKLVEHSPFIKLIASGGISSMDEIKDLQQAKVESVVVGKAIYEGRISVDEVKEWNLNALVSF